MYLLLSIKKGYSLSKNAQTSFENIYCSSNFDSIDIVQTILERY